MREEKIRGGEKGEDRERKRGCERKWTRKEKAR